MREWMNLQFFAAAGGEGGGPAGGSPAGGSQAGGSQAGGSQAGGSPADSSPAGAAPGGREERLAALGVPREKLRKRAGQSRQAPSGAGRGAPQARQQNPAAAEDGRAPRLSWEELMADPEYNRAMQKTVQERLKKAKEDQQRLQELNPALELLARRYGLPEQPDPQALLQALQREDSPQERQGQTPSKEETGLETAGLSAEAEGYPAAKTEESRREETAAAEQARLHRHYDWLQQQARELESLFPGFDLQRELENPLFLRMTAPDVGVPLQAAYFALHQNELQAASMSYSARKTAEKLASAPADRPEPSRGKRRRSPGGLPFRL